jgi:SAM-dependent methyltransferase
MAKIESTDYHDFVFKDGKLVGEFEQMYAKSAVAPWHQDTEAERLDCKIVLTVAESAFPLKGSVLDVGCGLGYFADLLAKRLPTGNVHGFDISETAVRKAAKLFPSIRFKVADIKKPLPETTTYDLVVIRGCFWYLFDAMPTVVANLIGLVSRGGHLLVAQNFPPLGQDFIGKEVIPNPDVLISHFSRSFETLVDCRFDDRTVAGGNDNWLIFLGRNRI